MTSCYTISATSKLTSMKPLLILHTTNIHPCPQTTAKVRVIMSVPISNECIMPNTIHHHTIHIHVYSLSKKAMLITTIPKIPVTHASHKPTRWLSLQLPIAAQPSLGLS